ncbi:UDP-D-xylose:L-fucose alpha-1,3-D-xylosyltransferase 1-like [Acanthaster planci]|uniref:UDP-D-xylose:L-fucose alpha-1,3-D-xylosyltransferase 1-like n=1 Tax=Acanthaster planci TaxID=133434 RepID=A0A8B7ZX15_ACAPL|nr:UDP-D-xylose:L-fucose alpha-1,3-D-xylosyltransferase 1-like [Acanthaster planci]
MKPAVKYEAVENIKTSLFPAVGTRERGQLSNCTLQDIMKRQGVVMLTTTNLGYLDLSLNMLASIRKVGVCVNTTIIAEDKTVYKYLRSKAEGDPAVHVVMTNSGEVQSREVWSKDFINYFGLLKKRQRYFLSLLKQGLEVLFTDSDTFWFSDPFPYFQGDFDMSMVDQKSPYPTRALNASYCAGFIYLRPTNTTLQFVRKWIMSLEGKNIMDQFVMNRLLRADQPVHVKVHPLDIHLFPSGPKFYQLLEQNANYSAVVMHAASIHGHAAKVAKFRSSNMWLVNGTSEELLAREHSLHDN